MKQKLRIGVVGSGSYTKESCQIAETVGCSIAKSGAILICGGRGGVMEAASRGAAKAGGLVIGILPSDNDSDANRYVDVPIVTGLGHARNVINVLTSHCVIAIAGGPGTLSEIAFALTIGKPVIAIKSWELAGPNESPKIFKASSAEEAVQKAIELATSCVLD